MTSYIERLARARLIVVVVVLGAAALGWWLFPSDARRVTKRFETLASLVSIPQREPDLERLARAKKFGALVTPDITVTIDDRDAGIDGRDRLMLLVAQPAGAGGPITITLANVDVQVLPDRQQATSAARARVTFTDSATKQQKAEDYDVRLEWRKVNGDWLVAAAFVRTLQGP